MNLDKNLKTEYLSFVYIKILPVNIQRPRGIARTEAEVKRYAEEDAAIARAKEEAKAKAAARANQNGSIHSPKVKLQPTCVPTLPESAVVTPSTKGPRLEGQRNLQDSTFSISGEYSNRFI